MHSKNWSVLPNEEVHKEILSENTVINIAQEESFILKISITELHFYNRFFFLCILLTIFQFFEIFQVFEGTIEQRHHKKNLVCLWKL